MRASAPAAQIRSTRSRAAVDPATTAGYGHPAAPDSTARHRTPDIWDGAAAARFLASWT
ncbi:hypothetical protein GCM10027261_26890 [Geodermatophilus arenarius]